MWKAVIAILMSVVTYLHVWMNRTFILPLTLFWSPPTPQGNIRLRSCTILHCVYLLVANCVSLLQGSLVLIRLKQLPAVAEDNAKSPTTVNQNNKLKPAIKLCKAN